MSLPVEQIALAKLLPTQATGVDQPILDWMVEAHVSPPVEVVALRWIGFILVDGHHRCVTALHRDELTISAEMARTNDDIMEMRHRAPALSGCRTLRDVRDVYLDEWLPHCQATGALSIATLPIIMPDGSVRQDIPHSGHKPRTSVVGAVMAGWRRRNRS